MTIIAFICIITFIICTVLYGIELRKIRDYIKRYHSDQFKKYSLDAASLMLGTDDVDWNFQKFVLNKRYVEISDKKLSELCEHCRILGITTYVSGVTMLIIVIAAGVVGS